MAQFELQGQNYIFFLQIYGVRTCRNGHFSTTTIRIKFHWIQHITQKAEKKVVT